MPRLSKSEHELKQSKVSSLWGSRVIALLLIMENTNVLCSKVNKWTLSLAFWLLSYKVETVPDLCLIALVFSRQLETFFHSTFKRFELPGNQFFFLRN